MNTEKLAELICKTTTKLGMVIEAVGITVILYVSLKVPTCIGSARTRSLPPLTT